MTYTYAADGTKLRTVHNINGTITQKDYCGSVIYENGAGKLWQTEAGYISMNVIKFQYSKKEIRMKHANFILAIIISQIFVFEVTTDFHIGINMGSIISFLSIFSWTYFIYILITVYKIRRTFPSSITLHKWLIPIATMICMESLLIYVVGPLFAKIIMPIAFLLYYMWIFRITMLLTVPFSYIIFDKIIKRLSDILQSKS